MIPRARRYGLRLLVTPDTIVRWYRDIVRRRWAARSVRGKTGRPAARRNIKALILRLARENPEWRMTGTRFFGTHRSSSLTRSGPAPKPCERAVACECRRDRWS